jgi:hypothetical protein
VPKNRPAQPDRRATRMYFSEDMPEQHDDGKMQVDEPLQVAAAEPKEKAAKSSASSSEPEPKEKAAAKPSSASPAPKKSSSSGANGEKKGPLKQTLLTDMLVSTDPTKKKKGPKPMTDEEKAKRKEERDKDKAE